MYAVHHRILVLHQSRVPEPGHSIYRARNVWPCRRCCPHEHPECLPVRELQHIFLLLRSLRLIYLKRGLAPPKKLVPFCLLDAELLHHRLYFKPFLKAQRRTSPPSLGVRKDAIHVHKHVKREKVMIQRRYRLLLLDHEIDSRGNNDNFRIPQRQTPRLCSWNQ